MKYVIGIDEVGRGCLAGPVAVGACIFLNKKANKMFRGVKDSKKLSPKSREVWLQKMILAKNDGIIDYVVSFENASVIDRYGLTHAIKKALSTSLFALNVEASDCKVLLDGGLRAPQQFKNQKTIIKGDEKEMVISLASVCAKVTRDRMMIKLDKKFPEYGFAIHKGYGTKKHYQAIKKYGLNKLHRMTWFAGK